MLGKAKRLIESQRLELDFKSAMSNPNGLLCQKVY